MMTTQALELTTDCAEMSPIRLPPPVSNPAELGETQSHISEKDRILSPRAPDLAVNIERPLQCNCDLYFWLRLLILC